MLPPTQQWVSTYRQQADARCLFFARIDKKEELFAVLLLILGFPLYREAVTVSKLVGLALCIAGLFFLNK